MTLDMGIVAAPASEGWSLVTDWTDATHNYLAAAKGRGDRPETLKLRRYHLRRLAADSEGGPWEISTDDLLAWLGSHGWSTSTMRSHRTTLRSFYRWAEIARHVDRSPATALYPIRVQEGRRREPASDIALAWGLRARDPRVRLMVRLAARTGMRAGEIARSSREDVVDDLLGSSLIVHGKGGKQRTVPLDDVLARDLLAMPPGAFFPGQIDGHLSESYVSKLISRHLPEGQTAHMFRHRRAGKAFKETGRDLVAVARLLGHASVATTQIYVPDDDEQLRRAVGGVL